MNFEFPGKTVYSVGAILANIKELISDARGRGVEVILHAGNRDSFIRRSVILTGDVAIQRAANRDLTFWHNGRYRFTDSVLGEDMPGDKSIEIRCDGQVVVFNEFLEELELYRDTHNCIMAILEPWACERHDGRIEVLAHSSSWCARNFSAIKNKMEDTSDMAMVFFKDINTGEVSSRNLSACEVELNEIDGILTFRGDVYQVAKCYVDGGWITSMTVNSIIDVSGEIPQWVFGPDFRFIELKKFVGDN